MSYKELDGGEGGMGEKGGESQTSVTISLLPFPIIDVVLSPIVLLLSESEWSSFYTDHPLPSGLSCAYRAAATFSNSSLTINVSQSSLADRDDPVTQSSSQGEDSNTTLISTVPSTPATPSTPTIIPPSRPPFSKSLCIPSHILQQRNAIIFAAGLASSSTTNNVCSALGATQSSTLHLPPILWNPFQFPL